MDLAGAVPGEEIEAIRAGTIVGSFDNVVGLSGQELTAIVEDGVLTVIAVAE